MMDVQLKTLEMQNFKGVRALRVEFSAGVTSIYGDNGTGKSTIYDALMWLFFGRDAAGNAKFTVKPAGREGVTPMVTAICMVNGQPRKFSKVLRERWSKPRGLSELRYDGDTVDYTIDDVPRKESEYKRMVSEIVKEDLFAMLMGVHHFARDLPWRERRQVLTEVCGLPDDDTLLCTTQFAPIKKAIGQRTVEEYKLALVTERKGVNKTLDALPIRMDECRRGMETLEASNYPAAQLEKEQLGAQCKAIRTALAKLDGDAMLSDARATHKALCAEQRALEAENAAHRKAQAINDTHAAAQAEHMLLEHELTRIGMEITSVEQTILQGTQRIAAYETQARQVEGETFTAEACPTCGQTLPEEQLAQARARFEADKAQRLDNLAKDCAFMQSEVERAEQSKQRKTHEQAQKMAQKAECAARLAAWSQMDEILDLPDYQTRKCALDLQTAQVLDRIGALESGQEDERMRLTCELSALEAQAANAERVLASERRLQEARERLSELAREKETCVHKLKELDDNIALCEAFARYKVQFLTRAVNSRFQLAQFRLFHEQLNGGIADCCEVVVNGVPYADLNHAMQVNVGLDIIRTLSMHFGVSVPLVVDNAESVTQLQTLGLQVIRLVVSEKDKVLRVEWE